MRLGVARAVIEDRILDGDVVVEEGVVTEAGVAPAGRGGLGAPGLIDLQVNGFAGIDFLSATAADYTTAGVALAATGVTAYQPTFISSPLGRYEESLGVVTGLPEAPGGPRLLGVHLEGPFLSPEWAGAHNPDNLLDPDPDLALRLCGMGPVTYMTVAPELPGGLELVARLVEHGIVVACGHTDADAGEAHAAFDAGATAITHIYNAHRRWSPRDPGVALVRPDVTVQAIADLVHLAPESVYAACLATGGRFAIVTDAMMAAGMKDGSYQLGDRTITVASGEARTADGALAGSVSTMDRSIRNLVSLGAPLEQALAAASRSPAKVIGREDLGRLSLGVPADIVVLDDSLNVVRTLVAGREVYAAR